MHMLSTSTVALAALLAAGSELRWGCHICGLCCCTSSSCLFLVCGHFVQGIMFVTAKKKTLMLRTAKLVTFVFPFPVIYSFLCLVTHDLVTFTAVTTDFQNSSSSTRSQGTSTSQGEHTTQTD